MASETIFAADFLPSSCSPPTLRHAASGCRGCPLEKALGKQLERMANRKG